MKTVVNIRSLAIVFLSVVLFGAATTSTAAEFGNPLVTQLEGLAAKTPNDPALRYYLGVLHLRDGNRTAAIMHWDTYLKLARDDQANSKYVSVREQITILKSAQAREAARQALANESGDAVADANTIAVLELVNGGSREAMAFAKGMTAMIITDLSKVPQLKVVERAKMQALVNEMNLATTGIVDPATSARMGRMLEAQTINAGSLSFVSSDVKIDNILSDTFTRTTIGEDSNRGPKETFFELEKTIVFNMLQTLGINKEDLDDEVLADIESIQTRSYDAFILFGAGLAFLDDNQFAEAKDSFEQAVEADPEFDLAQEAEMDTPANAVDPDSFQLDDPVASASESESQASEDAAGATADDSESGAEAAGGTEDGADEAVVTGFATDSPTDNSNSAVSIADATSDITQDATTVESDPDHPGTGGGGPTQQVGYFTNMLRNAAGDFHGIYFTTNTTDLNNIAAESLFGGFVEPAALTGSLQQIDTLFVVDASDPITIGMPNPITINATAGSSSYIAWGPWNDTTEMIRQSNPAAPNGHYLFDTTGYVVYGDATSTTQMTELAASQRSFTYSGEAKGTHFAEPNVTMTGTFTAQVEIQGGVADMPDFDLSVSSANHSAALTNGLGYFFDGATFSVFGGSWAIDGQSLNPNDTGQTMGSLYGPNGEAMGGIFVVEKDFGANSVVGAFQGSR